MHNLRLALCLLTVTSLSVCGLGETAAVASLEAEKAEQLKQQIEQANALSQERLQNLEKQQP